MEREAEAAISTWGTFRKVGVMSILPHSIFGSGRINYHKSWRQIRAGLAR